MMIRVNGEYLDFNDDIEIESQVKLFEEISTSNGDYSYSFQLPTTSKNLKALGFPFPDTIKSIYNNVPCDIVDESGFVINSGSLRIETLSNVINCSFFGGNNDWFSLLNPLLSDLPLQKYDKTLTNTNISASWSKSSGLVFPIFDSGALITRSFYNLKIEDFFGCFYMKTLFAEIFGSHGIKLDGDLLVDDTFNKMLLVSNNKRAYTIDPRSCFVQKTVDQTVTNSVSSDVVTFTGESSPFFDGSKGNYDTAQSVYNPDVKMVVDIDFFGRIDPVDFANVGIFKNSASVARKITYSFQEEVTISARGIVLEVGDTIRVRLSTSDITEPTIIRAGSTLRVTPTFVYAADGKACVPEWTQGQLVSNVFQLLNVVPSYNSDSKTLTLDLFQKIKTKEPIDVSDRVTIVETDFSEFISNYGKQTLFKYQDSSNEDLLNKYNISNFIKYGSGAITVDNDFIEETADAVEVEFTAPITYFNSVFYSSMERINFVELDEDVSKDITSVTDSSGTARLNIASADDDFTVGDLVLLATDNDNYNGQYVVNTVTTTYITVNGITFDSSATGTATKLVFTNTDDDSVYVFLNAAGVSNLFYSNINSMYLESAVFNSSSLAFFNLLSAGREIDTKYKQGLSFGAINNENSNQLSLIDTYWGNFGSILNDPVLLRVLALFKRKTYLEIKSFLRPLRIKTNNTNNLYYLNRMTGYKSGHEDCEGELIKL